MIDTSHGGAGSQDFELNIASIIDCFTVLITFMLASASFISLGVLDAGVAAAGATANPTAPPPVSISVELKTGHQMVVKISGKENHSFSVAANTQPGKEDWNYEAMTAQLSTLKSKWKDISAVTLLADNAIEYKEVVKSMEQVRKTMPVVLLGGF